MAEVGEKHFETSELARELKTLYPHLRTEIEKLEQMLFGHHLHEALLELGGRAQIIAAHAGRELLNEFAAETQNIAGAAGSLAFAKTDDENT